MATYGHTFTSGDTLTPTKLNNARTVTDIVNADIKSDAAIAGTKIAPDFGSQNVTTTGQAAVGTAISANAKLNVGGTMPAQTTQRALAVAPSFDNNASVGANAVITGPSTAANGGSAYTIPALTHFSANQGTLHADSTVTNQYGLLVGAGLTGATNNFGVASQIPAGTDRWNVYASGTAPNYFAGPLRVGTTANFVTTSGTDDGLNYNQSSGILYLSNTGQGSLSIRRRTSDGAIATFVGTSNTAVGSISVTSTATAYNVSSDYRLKQNVEPLASAAAKLAALSPKTFEFIAEPNVKVDGFIAHEVQAVVPQAVTGEKDGEEMQGLDMSKLVPLLVAAVQELSAKVAALEAAR